MTTRPHRRGSVFRHGTAVLVMFTSLVVSTLATSSLASARPETPPAPESVASVGRSTPDDTSHRQLLSRALAPNPHVPERPQSAPDRCVAVLVVGFRGSGAHPRGRTAQGAVSRRLPIPWTTADFVDASPEIQRRRYGTTAAEDRLGTTIAAFYEALRGVNETRGETVGFWSVGVDDEAAFGYGNLYRAPPVDVANLGRYLSSIRLDSLTTRLGPALADLVQGRYARPAQCPDTELVLVGFSQGAVIARATALDLEARAVAANRGSSGVSDVVLIGDPLFERGDHRQYGAAFDSDHHTDGLLRLDLAAWCDRNWLSRRACERYAGGNSRSRTWFRSVWTELRAFGALHPDLMASSAADLAGPGTDVHVICDSGDIVCSPIRWTSPFTWDSDIPEVLAGRPEDTIHGNYATDVDWDEVARAVIT